MPDEIKTTLPHIARGKLFYLIQRDADAGYSGNEGAGSATAESRFGEHYGKIPLLGMPLLSCIDFDGPYCEKLGSNCWDWAGNRFSRNGYGRTKDETGRERAAHRVIFKRLVGPIPDGAILDHLCGRRPCVNPAHMDPVTHQTNTHRGKAVLFKKADEYTTRTPPPMQNPPLLPKNFWPVLGLSLAGGLVLLCMAARWFP